MQSTKTKKRIAELDILRGVAVILMIFDHFMFDLWGLMPSVFSNYPPYEGAWRSIYSFARYYWNWDVRICVRYFVVFVFLALTGVCCCFSRSNIKRGLRLGGVSVALSVLTLALGLVIGDLDMAILFGVLHCIALSLILVGIIEKFIGNRWVFLILGVCMTALGWYLERGQGYLSLESSPVLEVLLSTIAGTAASGSDSFSFLFNGGQIFIGVFLGKTLYSERTSLFGLKYRQNLLSFVGRHSLVVYIAHQAVIPLLLGGIMLACGFSF